MKHGGKVAICIAASMGLQLSAHALTADPNNPYTPIVDRNVFSLKPIPVVDPAANTPPPTPPQKITLLGIVSYLGKKEVIFKTLASSKPGEAQKETTFSLGVGELQGDVEIIDIDHLAGTVRLKNHSVDQFLSLEKDGMKPAGGAGAPGVGPGAPGVPGVSPVPTAPAAPGGAPSPFGGAANVQRPIRGSAPTPSAPTTAAGYSTQSMTAEEQAAVMEVQRVLTKDRVDRGELPPLPPPPTPGGFNRPSPGQSPGVPQVPQIPGR